MSSLPAASILVTGFLPFGKDTLNPSGLIAQRLGGIALPVAAEDALQMALAEMEARGSDFLLALGVAGGRAAVCVESVAVNQAQYRIPDHNGDQLNGPIASAGAPGVFSSLDTGAIVAAIRCSGVPATVSQDAGRYVCNHFYFRLLERLPGRCLFLHIPRLPEVEAALEEGGAGPTMALETSERAVRAVIDFLGAPSSEAI